MKVFKLNSDQVGYIAQYLRSFPATEIRLAYDEIDGGIKIKFDNGVWSPAMGEFEEPTIVRWCTE